MKSLIKSLSFFCLAMLITVPSFAYIVTNPSFVNFGQVKVGGFSGGWRTISVQNQDKSEVNINVSSFCPMEFRVNNMCMGQLYSYASCSITVEYSPRSPGYHSCTISIRDSQGGYQSVSVSGSAHQ